ncbi:MAG: transcription elongation factor GreA [Patescibacteria group bacterium]|nr:transcription elongation factor GreA [Patescibacteria group bacterium]
MTTHYLTKEGLEKLKKEHDDLKSNKLPEVIERIARAKELGDLSENAEYQDAKEEQGFIVGRIEEIENMLRKAQIIDESHDNKEWVTVGSSVKIRCGDKEYQYTITGSNESNPAKGLISNESPMGRAFLGKRAGEKVLVSIPKGDMECEILEIV